MVHKGCEVKIDFPTSEERILLFSQVLNLNNSLLLRKKFPLTLSTIGIEGTVVWNPIVVILLCRVRPLRMSLINSKNITKGLSFTKRGFLGGSVVKNPPANVGDMGLIPGFERSPGGGNGNPL